MQAAVFKAVGKPLEIEEVADPTPGSGEVVLRVARCGICGSDLHLTEAGGRNPPSGTVIGHEVAGEVVAIGRDVDGVKIGDRVASLPILGCGACDQCLGGEPAWCVHGLRFTSGGYAQYARASARGCLVLPQSLSLEDGALVEPMAVALHGISMIPDIARSAVQVLGAGPIGLGVIYWLRRLGAGRIDVVEGNPLRAEMAMSMGATAVHGISEGLPTTPDGAAIDAPQIVFECVGKPGLLANAIARVRPRGTIVSLGVCMEPEPITALTASLKEVTLKFPVLYSLAEFQNTIDAFEEDGINPRTMVTDTIGLEDVPQCFESLRKPSHQCKVMIDPWR